jgi:Aspartyl protease
LQRLVAACLCLAFALNSKAQTSPVTISMKASAGVEIVQVSLNGSGPYPFVLDTGANVSMVKRRLLQELKVPIAGAVVLVAALGESLHERAQLQSVSLSGLSVQNVEVNTLEGSELGGIPEQVQGVLGENFLDQFDLLIDNDKQLLVLDQTPQLENSLTGEQLQISHSGISNASPTAHRIFVPLKLPDLLTTPVLFLVDSATNAAIFYPLKNELPGVKRLAQYGSIHSLSSDQQCHVEHTGLDIGSHRYRDIVLATCEGMTRDAIDTDGLLPTSIFHSLFICHRIGYVIANPRRTQAGRWAMPNSSTARRK